MNQEQFSILLVDDDEVDRMMVRRTLKKANFLASLTEAKNGKEAIAELKMRINNIVPFPKTDFLAQNKNNRNHYLD